MKLKNLKIQLFLHDGNDKIKAFDIKMFATMLLF